MAFLRTDIPAKSEAQVKATDGLSPQAGAVAPTGVGYGPSQLQSAYNLAGASAGGGTGATVAVVAAYNDPNVASDLATYRSAMALPACGSGCFTVVNENGASSPLPPNAGSNGWDVEESLDVDMVSAICPNCKILLVEANSASASDLGNAVNTAVAAGADYVSNSYGGPETASDLTWDTRYYDHPGVAVTASAGDNGYGVAYPASSSYVVAVGGTSLRTASNARGWTESVWGSPSGGQGTGSGCSQYEPKPSWQTDTGCSHRTVVDVSAVADPNTGVAVYDSYSQGGWLEIGGTSASAPIIAATYALAGTPAAGTDPASYLYAQPSDLFDVTSGANGTCSPAYLCTAETGYDGPSGLGTPDGTAAFTASGSTTTLTVSPAGAGSGNVASSPSGINCGGAGNTTCSATFSAGTKVLLTATPASGSGFEGFSGGGCTGLTKSCTVTVGSTQTVTATFGLPPSVSIASPTANQTFGVNDPSNPKFAFSCSPGAAATPSTCVGTVGSTTLISGQAIDTSTVGNYTLTVTATDTDGLSHVTTVNYSVTPAAQTITWPQQGPYTYGQAPVSLNASSSSNLPVTYTRVSGPCSVSGSTLTLTGAGSCVVDASLAGNNTSGPTVAQTIVINRAPTVLTVATAKQGLLQITFSATLTRALDGAPIGGQTVVFSELGRKVCQAMTSNPGVASCTVNGLTLGLGSYTAAYSVTANYLASTGSAKM